MQNWSTDTRELKKNNKAYTIWKLEQMVNFGTGGKKIEKKLLIKYWKELKLDKVKRNFLRSILFE